MSSVLAPARLPSHQVAIHDPDSDSDAILQQSGLHTSSQHPSARPEKQQYDYLQTLITRQQRSASQAKPAAHATVFCVSLPESIVVPGLGGGYASLTPLTPLTDEIMATVYEVDEPSYTNTTDAEDSVPSSPPDLDYSKSSKSSSSLTSDEDISDAALSVKADQFEEVSLKTLDQHPVDDSNLPPDSRPTLRRQPRRSASHQTTRRASQSPPLSQFPNGSQSRFPSLHGAVHSALQEQSLNLPHSARLIRTSSNPTSPYTRQHAHRFASRSPSPRSAVSNAATPKASLDAASPPASGGSRRLSWQPGRKTVEELEAEYNADDDDEVPEDMILENVPVSPMPGQNSTFLRSPIDTSSRSTTPSPNRRPSYANLHSANIPKHARRPIAPPASHPHSRSPRSPIGAARPPFPHSNTVGALPGDNLAPHGQRRRSKVWTDDLNPESKRLSQALELHERMSQDPSSPPGPTASGTNSAANSPPRPSIPKRAQTVIAVTELPSIPPMQKGNIMIDPLPISKEKEAVLTRTRPSWLPPKSKKEEKRHLKEFQQMMARAAEAEKKRAVRDQEARETREELKGSIARIWERHVLPNWSTVVKEPRTRELWWRGVTPHTRSEVWRKALGNDLGLSAASYNAALARARALEARLAALPAEERAQSKEAAWLDAIARDVPGIKMSGEQPFAPNGPLHRALTNVLHAYAMYRSDVGYVYGTHLIAGLLCLTCCSSSSSSGPADAFILLANLLNRPLPLAFLVHDEPAMQRTYALVLSALKYKFPSLHAHLTAPALGLAPREYLDPLFRCLFAYNLPAAHVARIWDLYAFEGDRVLIRAAVAVLGCLESRLYGDAEELRDLISWRCEGVWSGIGDEEEFVKAIREAGKVEEKSGLVVAAL